MKRQSGKFYYFGIPYLVLVFILFLGGCSGGEYGAEKLYWRANKSYILLQRDFKTAKPEDFQKVIVSFRKVVLQYPNWRNSSQAQLFIGELYALQDDELKAKAEFEKVLKNYPRSMDVCAIAQFAIGTIYEDENDWNKALEEYKKIVINYPYTYTAYQVPLYIARHYKSENQDAEAEVAYKEAIEHYGKIIKEQPNTFAAITAQNFIVVSLLEQKKWNEAIDYLQSLIDAYPQSALAVTSLYTIGTIYQERLNQPQKAINIYQKIVDKYPDSEVAKSAEKQIETIKAIK